MSKSNVILSLCILLSIVSYNAVEIVAFLGPLPSSTTKIRSTSSISNERTKSFIFNSRDKQQRTKRLSMTDKEEDDGSDDKEKENPFQDPNYPDLEFVDYSDPNYIVDQGLNDEFFAETEQQQGASEDDTEEVIEEMREERRLRNDEFQFETYFKDILQGGEKFNGEWTIYKTSTFTNDDDNEVASGGFPQLRKVLKPLMVTSRGYKQQKSTKETTRSVDRLDNERICHEEIIITDDDSAVDDNQPLVEAKQTIEDIKSKTYWPKEMSSFDFRGQQGNMCVGTAYTLCTGVSISDGTTNHEGPYEEIRTELGIQSNQMRFRVKFDYSILGNKGTSGTKDDESSPPLHLKSIIVCRETLGEDIWPSRGKFDTIEDRMVYDALFGPQGAQGGLYDPPPVGSEEQSSQYMLIDLEGGATILFPYLINQDPSVYSTTTGSSGWVTSLDWTPGPIRYQVDRKVHTGHNLLGLRTLELSEVQGMDAEQYRPKDGGQDMRQ